MKRKIFLLLVFLAVFFAWPGCATASKYTGPVSDRPLLSVSYMRHLQHTGDFWDQAYTETIATAAISNPSTRPMTVVLDCTRTLTTLTIAPRTTEYVLLSNEDRECQIQ
jgi:hypothetical protein